MQENNIEIKHIPGFTWTPVRTKPRREKKVAEYCVANEINFYLPLNKRVHRYERRTVEFFIPMFSGYIFCNLNEDSYKRLVRSNAIVYKINVDEPGEKRLIRELESVKVFEKLTHCQDVVVSPELVKGVKVKVVSGALMGMDGIVMNRKDKTVVSINIEILGQSVATEVDAGDLKIDE